MRYSVFAAGLTLLAHISNVSARKGDCVVRNTAATGPGSLHECMEEAHEAGSGDFAITFNKAVRDGAIITLEGDCLTSVGNPDVGTAVKNVIIEGPRRGAHVVVDGRACSDVIFSFDVDVSVHMSHLSILAGTSDGIFVFGADSATTEVQETVSIEDVTVEGAGVHGIHLIDVKFVHIRDTSVRDSGDDGFRYEQVYGTNGDYDLGITDCHFNENGRTEPRGDGADIRPEVSRGHINIDDSEFAANGDDGCDVEASGIDESIEHSRMSVHNSHFNGNFDEGLKSFLVNLDIKRSECDNNGDDGLEVFEASMRCVRSQFNGNNDDGMSLTDGIATELKYCEFNGNAEYGIELEIEGGVVDEESFIRSIVKSSFTNNGFGAITCEQDDDGQGRSARSSGTGADDDGSDNVPSVQAAEKAADGFRGGK